MDYKPPHKYPRRILLAVTGHSPQIVTETLYALALQQSPVFMPNEIHIITTKNGADVAKRTLFDRQNGWVKRLCREYTLPTISPEDCLIHTIKNHDGDALDDIRSDEENQQAANSISHIIRQLTSYNDTALHVCLSGGRRSMTFYVGYALSLFGRMQDRLSHVLVSDDYQFLPDFYYPTKQPHTIYAQAPSGKALDASQAQVTLADIPFVRLRQGIPQRLMNGKANFSETVSAIQAQLSVTRLTINLSTKTITCGNQTFTAPANICATYALFALRKLNGKPPINWRNANTKEYLRIYGVMVNKHSGDFARVEKALVNGFTAEMFESRKAKLQRFLKDQLGSAASVYLLQTVGKRPNTAFECGLLVGQIEVLA